MSDGDGRLGEKSNDHPIRKKTRSTSVERSLHHKNTLRSQIYHQRHTVHFLSTSLILNFLLTLIILTNKRNLIPSRPLILPEYAIGNQGKQIGFSTDFQ